MNYGGMAWVYELLGVLYSGGAIYAAKASQVAEMRPGDKVLYVGVGPGEDALLAARLGAEVTCVDIASQMLALVEARLAREGLKAELICGDLYKHDRFGHYDVVAINFFLNIFTESAMREMLTHVARFARPGGKVLISDYTVPAGNLLSRGAQIAYWRFTNVFYYLLGLMPWHPVYDYPRYFDAAGLDFESHRRFAPFRICPGGYCSITARRRPLASAAAKA